MNGIVDVEQDAVARAGAGREADLREYRDVVALVRGARRLRAGAAFAAFFKAGDRAGLRVGEDARPVDDRGFLGGRERHFDDVDAEERGVRIVVRIPAGAARELFARSHGAGTRPVDVQVGFV